MTGCAQRIVPPMVALVLVCGCNPKQARAKRAAVAYRTLLREVVKFNEAFKARPEAREVPRFEAVLNENIALLTREDERIQGLERTLKEDALLREIAVQAFTIEQMPPYLRSANYVSGIPETHYSKREKLVILWTEEMRSVIQPRVNEINKIASEG